MKNIHKIDDPHGIFLQKILLLLVFYSVIIIYIVQLVDFKPFDFLSKDFFAFYTGAKIVNEYGVDRIYDINLQVDIQNNIKNSYYPGEYTRNEARSFRNIPIVSLIFTPFANLDYVSAAILSGIFAILLIFVSLFLLLKINFDIILFLGSFFSIQVSANIFEGQISSIILISLIFIYFSYKKKNFFIAGLLSSLFLIKAQFLTLVPLLFLLTPRRKFIEGFIVGFISMILLNSFLYGFDFLPDYVKFLHLTEVPQYGTSQSQNYNIIGFFGGKLNNSVLGYIIIAIQYLIFCFVLYKSKSKNFDLKFSAVILAGISTMAHVMVSDLIVMLIPLFLLNINGYRKIWILCYFIFLPYLGFISSGWIVSVFNYLAGCKLVFVRTKL